MPNWFERMARLHRGLQDDIEDLKQAVADSEGIPNLLRSVTDRTTVGDSVSVTINENASPFVADSSNADGGDLVG